MNKAIDKKYLILGILLAVFLLLIFSACSLAIKEQSNPNTDWIIRSYEDTVVLMKDGEVIEVFGDISLDSLPNEDKEHLEKGINFLTKDEALLAIEDYDG